jgi:hypothetical protein
MKRNKFKNSSSEDKFARKYYCSLNNHKSGWAKVKRENRKIAKLKLREELKKEIKNLD